MPLPRTIKSEATYAITLSEPIVMAGRTVNPDASEIRVTGAYLRTIRDKVADGREVPDEARDAG